MTKITLPHLRISSMRPFMRLSNWPRNWVPVERVVQILNRRQKNNPCLIGEPGVGKTAIALLLLLLVSVARSYKI